MPKTWRCGDCGAVYPRAANNCTRPFDDYVSLRGGSIESAIYRAVSRAIEPRIALAMRSLRPESAYALGPEFAIAA